MRENMEDKLQFQFNVVNDLFLEYVEIFPTIELQEKTSFEGTHVKLKVSLDENIDAFNTLALIFFDLHHRLHSHNKRNDIKAKKILVSELIFAEPPPGTAFRPGFIIKMKYEQ
jgi:hypothetical protein